MDLDACLPGNRRFTRVVARVWRPGLFYHKVALRLAAFACQDLNATSCWVIRNHLRYKKVSNDAASSSEYKNVIYFFCRKSAKMWGFWIRKPCQQKFLQFLFFSYMHLACRFEFYLVSMIPKYVNGRFWSWWNDTGEVNDAALIHVDVGAALNANMGNCKNT